MANDYQTRYLRAHLGLSKLYRDLCRKENAPLEAEGDPQKVLPERVVDRIEKVFTRRHHADLDRDQMEVYIEAVEEVVRDAQIFGNLHVLRAMLYALRDIALAVDSSAWAGAVEGGPDLEDLDAFPVALRLRDREGEGADVQDR